MKRWASLVLLAAACLALGAAATALAEGKGKFVLDRWNAFRAPPPPDRAPPPPAHAEDRAGDHLAEAYDALTLIGLCEGKQSGNEASHLLESSREFYRAAHKAYKAGEFERAAETALAANDGARGVLYTLKANASKQAGLPPPPVVGHVGPPPPPQPPGDRAAPPPPRGERRPAPRGNAEAAPPPGDRPPPPPRGDREPPPRGDREAPPPPPPGGPGHSLEPTAAAKEAIQHAVDRLEAAPTDVTGPGRAFLDAAHKALDRAKQAEKNGDFFKAVELARAAEAWSHVEEHLHRAEGADGDGPPPQEEHKGAELKRKPPMPPSAD